MCTVVAYLTFSSSQEEEPDVEDPSSIADASAASAALLLTLLLSSKHFNPPASVVHWIAGQTVRRVLKLSEQDEVSAHLTLVCNCLELVARHGAVSSDNLPALLTLGSAKWFRNWHLGRPVTHVQSTVAALLADSVRTHAGTLRSLSVCSSKIHLAAHAYPMI